ncbi:MAG: hypothetical protein AVDCRST_MAG13-3231, partial [uncultured Solirubrobacteraceae bacterium]
DGRRLLRAHAPGARPRGPRGLLHRARRAGVPGARGRPGLAAGRPSRPPGALGAGPEGVRRRGRRPRALRVLGRSGRARRAPDAPRGVGRRRPRTRGPSRRGPVDLLRGSRGKRRRGLGLLRPRASRGGAGGSVGRQHGSL